jgi:hypothetical protein
MVVFNDGNGVETEVNDLDYLKNRIIDQFEVFCSEGSGDGFIDYRDNGHEVTLMIEPNPDYGIYLRFVDDEEGIELLSLSDKNNLSEVVEVNDDLYASLGLFVPIEEAWKAISDFVTTGRASDRIEWISVEDMPEDGNW